MSTRALVRLVLVALLLSGCATSQSLLDFFEALTVAAGRAALDEVSCEYQSVFVAPGGCGFLTNTCRDDGFREGDALAFDDPPEWLTIEAGSMSRSVCVAPTAPLVSGNFSYTYVRFGPQLGVLGLTTAPLLFVREGTATPQFLRTGESTRLDVVIEPTQPGAPPYQFAWVASLPGVAIFDDPGRRDPVATIVARPPGGEVTFTVTVTDAAGQTGQGTVRVGVAREALRVSATATPSTINRGESSQLLAIVENGSPPFSYNWASIDLDDFFAVNPVATPRVTTTYEVKVTDDDFQEGTATVTVTVIQPPPSDQADLTVTITDSPDPVTRNTLLTYTVRVTNNGPAAATNVELRVSRPTMLETGNLSLSQGTCTVTAINFTCPIGTMASGAVVTGTLQAFPFALGTIDIGGSVATDVTESDLTNNSAGQTTTVVAAPN